MKIELLLLPEYGEQSEQKKEQNSLFFPLQPNGCAAGFSHDLHWDLLFCILEPAWGV